MTRSNVGLNISMFGGGRRRYRLGAIGSAVSGLGPVGERIIFSFSIAVYRHARRNPIHTIRLPYAAPCPQSPYHDRPQARNDLAARAAPSIAVHSQRRSLAQTAPRPQAQIADARLPAFGSATAVVRRLSPGLRSRFPPRTISVDAIA